MFFETHGIVVVLSLGVAKLEKLIKVQVWGFASWICRFLPCVHVAKSWCLESSLLVVFWVVEINGTRLKQNFRMKIMRKQVNFFQMCTVYFTLSYILCGEKFSAKIAKNPIQVHSLKI